MQSARLRGLAEPLGEGESFLGVTGPSRGFGVTASPPVCFGSIAVSNGSFVSLWEWVHGEE